MIWLPHDGNCQTIGKLRLPLPPGQAMILLG
jgi:hypothetical protein